MKNYQKLVHIFDKNMKVNLEHMAKEDSLNIYSYDDLRFEIEKLKMQYHKIQMIIHHYYSIDELKELNHIQKCLFNCASNLEYIQKMIEHIHIDIYSIIYFLHSNHLNLNSIDFICLERSFVFTCSSNDH